MVIFWFGTTFAESPEEASPRFQDVGQAGEGFLQQFSVQLDLHLASNMREHEHHLRITQYIHKVRAGTLIPGTVVPTEYTEQSARLSLQSSGFGPGTDDVVLQV